MICDVINDVTEVGQKFENWRIYFIFSSFYFRMFFQRCIMLSIFYANYFKALFEY